MFVTTSEYLNFHLQKEFKIIIILAISPVHFNKYNLNFLKLQ